MLKYPEIDPVLFTIAGPFQVRWYGLMYVLGFIATYILVRLQIRRFGYHELSEHFENLNFVLLLGVVLGGRLGYILFYNLDFYLANPLQMLALTSGGMSFHGACIALIAAAWWFTRKNKIDFWKTADLYAATIPIGLGLGRIGNFINGELFGRTTEVPWGMVFPDGGPLARHPSQLYESFLEGLVLFIILWSVKSKPWRGARGWPHGSILALFLIGYGIFRSMVELVREPDQQIGFLFGSLTMGQLLSTAMILAGASIWVYRLHRTKSEQNR